MPARRREEGVRRTAALARPSAGGAKPRRLLSLLLSCVFALAAREAPGAEGFENGSWYGGKIVNGTLSSAFPAVGELVFYTDASRTEVDTLCSGTLVGCHTFMTAAHCVCAGDDSLDAATCAEMGFVDPALLRVFFQHAGFFEVSSMSFHPSFSFTQGGDVAIVELGSPVQGIPPAALNLSARSPEGTSARIVGFGNTGGRGPNSADYGIKREGTVVTAACSEDVNADNHVCVEYLGSGSTACAGDSGGPLFILSGNDPVIAGTTSGRQRESCMPPDRSFFTDVFVHRDWITSQEGVGDAACGDVPFVGSDGATVVAGSATLTEEEPDYRMAFVVPAGTRTARVGLNGRLFSGFDELANDFDLYVRRDQEPTDTAYDCAAEDPTPLGYCEIHRPQPGIWHVLVRLSQGEGLIQVTATTFAGTNAGDANCDAYRTAADTTALVQSIATGQIPSCGGADANGDDRVDSGDLRPLLEAIFEL